MSHSIIRVFCLTRYDSLLNHNTSSFHSLSYFRQMYLYYLFNDSNNMKDFALKYFETGIKPHVLLIIYSDHAFFSALTSYRLHRETGQSIWGERARKYHSMIKNWSLNGSAWNFEHKCDLLNAEEQYSSQTTRDDYEEIQTSYTNAIENARRHKFITPYYGAAGRFRAIP